MWDEGLIGGGVEKSYRNTERERESERHHLFSILRNWILKIAVPLLGAGRLEEILPEQLLQEAASPLLNDLP